MKPSADKQTYAVPIRVMLPPHRTWGSDQRGLSLIELMISITIGLLILVSLSTLFINQSKTRVELDKSNRMIDNGRYALELLSGNLRLAGFYDAYPPPTGTPFILTALPDPCDLTIITNPATNLDLLRLHVQGYDAATATATPAFSAAAPLCAAVFTANAVTLKPGSDILVIRRAGTTSVAQASAPNDGTTYLQVSNCELDTTLFKIDTNPANLLLGQKNIRIPTALNNCMQVASIITIAAPYANLRPFMVEVYFISPDNNPNDGIPTLKRLELTSGGFVVKPLVEGIEYMQVEYGLDDPAMDTDGKNGVGLDGIPDSYTSCAACTLADWSNVVAVKINLVARNTEATKGYTDTKTYSLGSSAGSYTPTGAGLNFKRHTYTQFVRLVNPASRREVP
jgi:type IV pilus assembly protein PilW